MASPLLLASSLTALNAYSSFEVLLFLREPIVATAREGTGFRASGKQSYISSVCPQMQSIEKLMNEIAPTDIPVLLLGESGTGKDTAALHIHALSHRKDLPFAKLSCAALTPESLEDRLNCYENGSAERNAKSTGTLFLDEIAELDANCQRGLLHSIPDGHGFGSNRSLAGRIVSCTTRDMDSELQGGKFRGDLFYRLNGVCLHLPPLRRRREDIPALIQHFLNKYAVVFDREEIKISDPVLRLLVEHPWPGNIRQLENVIKRVVALGNEELAIEDLKSPSVSRSTHRATESHSLKAASRAASQQAERELILQTLTRTHWNRKRAAEALQISYKSLLLKLKQIQIPDSEEL
jgi:two-component system response regulator AtoC